jgi:hypothetical protein
MQATLGGNNPPLILSPRQGNNNSKSNGPPTAGPPGHAKAQSLGDVTGILKNIMSGGAPNMAT